MTSTDPIADMLTRIRNASSVGKTEVVIPMSKIKYEIAKILEKEKWIHKVETEEADGKKKGVKFNQLRISLRYKKSGKSVINSLRRVSKPGLRIYVSKEELPRVLNDFGIAIISSPQGV
ncbi:MAG TPA: 30S ribosomal protein S8, partial [Patescibacteria group bacterium]|nr:30S ribosomal protein S8 [Patescibacteria group bacterium]